MDTLVRDSLVEEDNSPVVILLLLAVGSLEEVGSSLGQRKILVAAVEEGGILLGSVLAAVAQVGPCSRRMEVVRTGTTWWV